MVKKYHGTFKEPVRAQIYFRSKNIDGRNMPYNIYKLNLEECIEICS